MRVVGFYKLIDTYPSPVAPIFEKNGAGGYFAQIVDGDGNVAEFEAVHNLAQDRYIAEGNYTSSIETEVGNEALYAVAYNETHILVNRATVVRREIRDYIYENRGSIPPFAELEMAIFTGDTSLVEEAAERCRVRLDGSAPAVTRLWIDGAPLPEGLKWKLRNRLVKLDGSAPPVPATVRFGFLGPRRLMHGITDFCSNKMLRTRATVVRGLFSGSDVAHRINVAAGKIDGVLMDIAEKYSPRDGKVPLESWMVSRGRISLSIFDVKSYGIARVNFIDAIERSDYFRQYRSIPFYARGIESSNFLLIVCMLLQFQSGFEEHYGLMITEKAGRVAP